MIVGNVVLVQIGRFHWVWVGPDGQNGSAYTRRGALRQIERAYL